jgi:hypothetical protein
VGHGKDRYCVLLDGQGGMGESSKPGGKWVNSAFESMGDGDLLEMARVMMVEGSSVAQSIFGPKIDGPSKPWNGSLGSHSSSSGLTVAGGARWVADRGSYQQRTRVGKAFGQELLCGRQGNGFEERVAVRWLPLASGQGWHGARSACRRCLWLEV